MRKVLCAAMSAFLGVGALGANAAKASPILYEGFAYDPNTNLEDKVNSSVTGGAQDWDRAGSASNNTPIVSGSLNSPIAFQPLPTGNRVTVNAGATRADRLNFPVVSTGTIYYSLLLNVSDLTGQNTGGGANATGAFLFGFNNGNTDAGTSTVPSVLGARIQLRRDPSEASLTTGATKYNITIANSTAPAAGDFNDATAYLTNQTYFVLASYTFNTGGSNDDVAKIWINPNPGTFDPATTSPNDTYTGGDVASPGIQSIIVRSTGTLPTTSAMDEIRVSTDFHDVITAPEPASIGLLGIAAVGLAARRSRSRHGA